MLALLPALALSFLAAGSGVLPGDVTVTLFIQENLPSELSGLVDVVNAIGSTAGAILITALISTALFLRGQATIAWLILATLPLRLSNGLLKLILESPRPSDSMVQVSEYASGFGFPSGHTMGATLLYGALFLLAPYITQRRVALMLMRAGALIMIALAGFSRVHAGAHWPSDVVGAYLWAVVVLILGTMVVQQRGLLSAGERL